MKLIHITVVKCRVCPFRHFARGIEPPVWKCSHDDATWHYGPDLDDDAGSIPDWCPLPDNEPHKGDPDADDDRDTRAMEASGHEGDS